MMKNKRISKFNWYKMKQCYSLRKHHSGLASVLLGSIIMSLVGAPMQVDAAREANVTAFRDTRLQKDMYEPQKRDRELWLHHSDLANQADRSVVTTVLPQGTTYSFKTVLDTGISGRKKATVIVTYPDKSVDEVEVNIRIVLRKPVKVIVDNPNQLTATEKAQVEAAIRQANPNLKQGVTLTVTDNGTIMISNPDGSSDSVDPTDTIQAKPLTNDNKNQLKSDIDNIAAVKKREIDQRNDLTSEEKEAAKRQVDNKASEAKTAIDAATTLIDGTTLKNNAINDINAISPVAEKKPNAKAAIEEAARRQKETVNNRNDLTAEEKAAANRLIDEKATQAKNAIDSARTDSQVDTAKTNGLNTISSINPSATKKTEAKDAIDAAANEQKRAIDSRQDLTTEEKIVAKNAIDAKAKDVKTAIDVATTDSAVDNVKTTGITDIKAINPVGTQKKAAKDAIEAAATAKKATIDNQNDLTVEEKNKAKQEVDTAATAAKDAIDTALTNDAVNTAKTEGLTGIASVDPIPTKKREAKEAIDAAKTAQQALINQRTDLTTEEKDLAKQAIETKATQAKNAIDNATTDSAVDIAKNSGISDITQVNPEATKKNEAKAAIENAANTQKAVIDSRQDLTKEEKDSAKQKIDEQVAISNDAIDKATTNAGVDFSKTVGITAINAINPESRKKADANAEIDAAAMQKKTAIDNLSDLTNEEKIAAKQAVDEAARVAKEAIHTAVTNNDVDDAKTTGLSAINNIHPTAIKKTEAIAAVDTTARAKKEEIDGRMDLTSEEKEAAKREVDEKAAQAKQSINVATTDSQVDTAKSSGVTAIIAIVIDATKKTEAKEAIDAIAREKKTAIDERSDLTSEEKETAKKEVDRQVETAKQAISTAVSNDDVDIAKNSGINAIQSISPDAIKKTAAKKAIDDAAKAKKEAIDTRVDLTVEEKERAKAQVDSKVLNAKREIDSATTNSMVDDAKTTGETAITNINPPAIVKTKAKQAVELAATEKKRAIDERDDLTIEEKVDAKKQVDMAETAAKSAIDAAMTNDIVNKAKTDGIAEINRINLVDTKKKEAKLAIETAVTAKKAEIDKLSDLTDEEKQVYKEQVDTAATNAVNAINAATTNNDVDSAKTTGLANVANITPQATAKTTAKAEIDAVERAKKEEIDNRNDLTAEEKLAAKKVVTDKATATKARIDEATTNDAVTDAKAIGITDINNVSPTADKKNAAKQAIEEAKIAQKLAIEQRRDLTVEEKQTAKAIIEQEATNAITAIDTAKTDSEVDTAKTNGVTAIININPDATTKIEAKRTVEEAKQAKINAINNRTDLTDEEKQTAITQVEEQARQAVMAIDGATTNDAVASAKNNGVTAIQSVTPNADKKNSAKAEIDEVARAKKTTIDDRLDLTAEEKAVAKAQVESEVLKAKQAIDSATTNALVDTAKTNGVDTIQSINPTADKKNSAKSEIDRVANDKKSAITSRLDLTDEEKASAIRDVDSRVDTAKTAIDNALTNEIVDAAKATGETEIATINPVATIKTTAKDEIDETARIKKIEIDNRSDLTDEEKATAKQEINVKSMAAKQAVDNATTNAAVDKAKEKGIADITAINPNADKKDLAKAEIDRVANDKKAEINDRLDLTDEEKEAAKQAVDVKVIEAKEAIDTSTTNEQVEEAKTDGISIINDINPPADQKTVAKTVIDEVATAKKAEIDGRLDLTDEEKATAKQEVDVKATEAKTAIDIATTNAAVDKAKEKGIADITAINPSADKKDAAKAEIDRVANDKKAEIANRSDLTNEEKEAAKQAVDVKVIEAKEAIDTSTTNEQVEDVKTDGISIINDINPPADQKTVAKTVIDEVATAKKAEIDGRLDLTDEEKATAKQEVDVKATEAKTAIDNATTNAAVDKAKEKGIADITAINPNADKKDLAKAEIDRVAKAQKAWIDSRKDLSIKEKEAAKRAIDEQALLAKAAIDKANNDSAVLADMQNGIHAIKNINPAIKKGKQLLPKTGDTTNLLPSTYGLLFITASVMLLTKRKSEDD